MVEDPVSPIDPRTGDLARFASALAGAAGAWAVEEMVAHALDGEAAGARAALYRELIRRNRRRALSAPAEREDNMPVRRAEDFAPGSLIHSRANYFATTPTTCRGNTNVPRNTPYNAHSSRNGMK